MRHPAFTSWPRALLYVGCYMLAGSVFALSLAGLSPLSTGALVLEGLFSSLMLAGLTVLLWFVLRFTRLSGKTPAIRFFNHLALMALLLLVWLGTEHLLLYILVQPNLFSQLVSIMPLKLVVGSLVLLFMVQQYSHKGSEQEANTRNGGQAIYGGHEISNGHEISDEEPDMLEKAEKTQQPVDTITVKTGTNIHLIPVNELLYLQAEGDYVLLYTAQTRYIKEETMKHLESQLPATFVRIHRSYLVNTTAISRLELYEKQRYLVTLKSGHQLRVSASGYRVLKEKLQL